MHMYHFHRYTHTALSAAYGNVYTCPMGRLQRWCMYLVVCDAVLIIQPSTKDNNNKTPWWLEEEAVDKINAVQCSLHNMLVKALKNVPWKVHWKIVPLI